MIEFSLDEKIMILLYSPGTRSGLIAELKMMQSQLMISEKRLLRLSESVLQKLNKMNDAEFEDMDFFE
ncbi:transposon-transfer assisting family protein [[Ruminococcus] lactaris]|jgi:hypothetical protein|uniref:transposon-transfer assisting family protein n=1 Tax=[Ruminococcus] lactaris TaxID=46228 RepID=UPI0030795559